MEAVGADPQPHETVPGAAGVGHPRVAAVSTPVTRDRFRIQSGSIRSCARLLEGFFNSTNSLSIGTYSGTSVWQSAWNTFATVFGVLADLVGLSLGPVLLGGAIFAPKGVFNTNDLTGRVVDLAAGVLAVGIDVAGLVDQSKGEISSALFLSIWGTVLGGGALVMDQVLEKTDFVGPLKTLDTISDGIDYAGFGIGAATIILDKVPAGGP